MPTELVYALVAGVAVVAVGVPVAFRVQNRSASPVVRWARGAYGLLTGGDDFGELGEDEAQALLESPWGVHDSRALEREINRLEARDSGNEAWDLIRVMLLARLGYSAGYVDESASWQAVTRVALRLQAAYGGWHQLGEAYARGRSEWLSAQGIEERSNHDLVERNIKVLAVRVWPKIEFNAPLRK